VRSRSGDRAIHRDGGAAGDGVIRRIHDGKRLVAGGDEGRFSQAGVRERVAAAVTWR
jgi:hypothetical protein